MSSNRSILYYTDIEAFTDYAKRQGWEAETIPPLATYQVLRLRHPKARAQLVFYHRDHDASGKAAGPLGSTHITIPDGAMWLVMGFYREKKEQLRWALD